MTISHSAWEEQQQKLQELTEAGVEINVKPDHKLEVSFQGHTYQLKLNRDASSLTDPALFKIATLSMHLLFKQNLLTSSFEKISIKDKKISVIGEKTQEIPLADTSSQSLEEIRGTFSTGGKIPGAEEAFSSKLDSILSPPPTLFSKLKKYEGLYALVHTSQLDSSKEVQSVYKKIEAKFTELEFLNSPAAWAQKADLLDALDLLIDKYPHAHLEPIQIGTPPDTAPWRTGSVPLVPYSHLKTAIEKMENALGKTAEVGTRRFKDMHALEDSLKGIAVGEHSGTAGNIIRGLTSQKRNPHLAPVFGAIYRFMTRMIGWAYKNPALIGSNLSKIAKASRGMGIQPMEILSRKLADDGGEVFFYRGPRYLFDPHKSIHQYKTVDEWFGRDLTPRARRDYLNKVRRMEKDLTASYGADPKGASRVVISNSDSRVRVKQIEGEDFSKPQDIVGKVLSAEAEEEAHQNKDNPAYYLESYQFNTNNLLGLKTQDNLQPGKLEQKKIKAFQSAVTKTGAGAHREITQERDHEQLILDAQRELLAGMARTFQREGAIQVIQRLAPADVHNYTATVKGTPLDHASAVEALKNRLSSTDSNKEERAVLEQLLEVFTAQEVALGRKSQPTIDIYGKLSGNTSVQTNAIDNRPAILAQNDRKVMLFQHEDGSLSMHVFIGATGVNRVNVTTDSIQMEQGDRQGDMRPGEDVYQAGENSSFAATRTTTRDGLKKLQVGERQGAFNKQGSTVISYYLPADFTILPEINAFKEVGAYQGQTRRRKVEGGSESATMRKEAEVLCKMGDPLLVKTEIALVQYLERLLPDSFKEPSQTAETILADFVKIETAPTPSEQRLHELLRKMTTLPSEDLSYSENTLKEKLTPLLTQRLVLLNPSS